MKKAVFFDKDGTLIPDVPYNVDPDKILLNKNAYSGLKSLHAQGYLVIVITNQSGIARGMFNILDLGWAHRKIEILLANLGIRLSGFYYCPHFEQGKVSLYSKKCACRKPLPGMLLNAAKDHNIDLSASWMIGDLLDDVEAGNRAGCRSVLLNNGNENTWLEGEYRTPSFIASSIDEAASFILKNKETR